MKLKFIACTLLILTVLISSSVIPASASLQMGDVNGDGIINVMDVTLIQKKLSQVNTTEKYYSKYSDFDRSGNTNVTDATTMQKYIAGKVAVYNYYLLNIDEKSASVMRYFGTASNLTVPSRISGYSCDITAIDQKAFLNNNVLITVTLPSTIKKINDYAFYNCSALTTVYSNNKSLKWGNSFVSCPKFQSIKFK